MRFGWLLVVMACHRGAAAPAAPGCVRVADHVRNLLGPESPRASSVRDVFAARCNTDSWGADMRACVVATTSLRNPRHCKQRLTTEQRAALDRDLAEVRAAPIVVRLPAACRDYRAMIEKLRGCFGLPEGTRGQFELRYREITDAWSRGVYDTRTLEAQCGARLDGLRQALSARCGW